MAGPPESVDFVTLGMFIIDDIYPPPSASDQTPQKDVIGGAGTYSAVGARLFAPPPTSKSVGWIVDEGPDFPPELRSIIASWETGVHMRPRDGPTTRGWNGYGENEHRAFKYLTEKKRLTAADLTPQLLKSKSFHLICSATRLITEVTSILDRRRQAFGENVPRPLMIWEPVPDLATPEELDNTIQALQYVDVISPNHEELGSLLSSTHPSVGVDKSAVEEQAKILLGHGVGPEGKGAVIVRASKEGCYVASGKGAQHLSRWLPAYHNDASKVVDPTGGGNGFLGGLAIGLVHTDGDLVQAARMGSVAASFCIEQVGMPTKDEGKETWNGVAVSERLAEFASRAS
ncbi:hypothetical protein NU219Hw_g7018t1 [Hortaea werneckii]